MPLWTINAADDDTLYRENIRLDTEDYDEAYLAGAEHLAAAWGYGPNAAERFDDPDEPWDAVKWVEGLTQFAVDPAPHDDAFIALLDAVQSFLDNPEDRDAQLGRLAAAAAEAEAHRGLIDA